MPRVVPSDVVWAMDRMFGEMTSRPGDFPGLLGEHLPSLAGLVTLIDSIPAELLLLPPDEYTTLTVNLAYLRAVTVQFGGKPRYTGPPPRWLRPESHCTDPWASGPVSR